MKAQDIQPGDSLWYLYRIPGSVMQGQRQCQVLAVRGERVQISRTGKRIAWVKAKNLRPTN